MKKVLFSFSGGTTLTIYIEDEHIENFNKKLKDWINNNDKGLTTFFLKSETLHINKDNISFIKIIDANDCSEKNEFGSPISS